MSVTLTELARTLDQLDVDGSPVMIHSSLRSIGDTIKGGADGIVDAFIDRGCTLLVPTFTETHFLINPPLEMRPPRNGVDYDELPSSDVKSFAGFGTFWNHCGLIDANMGAFAAAVLGRPSSRRGEHPLDSFTALGPSAVDLISGQSPTDVYAPIRRLAELRGSIMLIGVGLNRMTAMHLAEQMAGRRLFIRWALDSSGKPVMLETGGCSGGFPKLTPCLRDITRTGTLGRSNLTVASADRTLTAAAEAILSRRISTSCGASGCMRCADAEAGGPGF